MMYQPQAYAEFDMGLHQKDGLEFAQRANLI